jgi:hypothetical protein
VREIHYLSFILSIFILSSCSEFSSIRSRAIASEDGWSYIPKGKTIAIGDVHADPEALLDILINKGVIDENGRFIGKNIDIVLLGDFANKGPDTRGVWDVINHIESEAGKHNSRVHAVFGNHDTLLLMGTSKSMKKKDLVRFKTFDSDPVLGIKKSLISEPYRSMMQKWKGMVKIGDSIYVHGGISHYIYKVHPSEINRIVNQYVINQQDYLDKITKGIDAIAPEVPTIMKPFGHGVEEALPDNPFWTRLAAKKKLTQEQFDRMLTYLDAKRVIAGHTPTKKNKIKEILNGKMILTDTKNSSGFKNGKLSALEINENTGKVIKSNDLRRGLNHNAFIKIVSSGIKGMKDCVNLFLGPKR